MWVCAVLLFFEFSRTAATGGGERRRRTERREGDWRLGGERGWTKRREGAALMERKNRAREGKGKPGVFI